MTKQTILDLKQQMATLAVAGAVVVMPLLSSPAVAQTVPLDEAAASSFRDDRGRNNRDNRGRDNRGRDRDRDDRGRGNWGNRTNFVGTVVTVQSAYSMVVRGDNGRTYTATTHAPLSRAFSPGDRVQVVGTTTTNNTIAAQTITILQDNGGGIGGGYGRINFRATVLSVPSAYSMVVRGDNGRTYTATTHAPLSRAFSPGDRVQVVGTTTNSNTIAAETITILQDNGGIGGGFGRVNFQATVVSVASAYSMVVRGDNGRTYTATTHAPLSRAFSPGDRVQVVGTTTNNNTIAAETITILRDNGGGIGGGYGRLNFRATVVSVLSAYSMVVRGDNGRTYTATTHAPLSRAFSPGDRVQVVGTVTNNIIAVETITILQDNAGSSSPVNFGGRVLQVTRSMGLWHLQVRGDNGQVYTVHYNGSTRFSVNDRVRVIGTFQNGYIMTSNVSRL